MWIKVLMFEVPTSEQVLTFLALNTSHEWVSWLEMCIITKYMLALQIYFKDCAIEPQASAAWH